MSKEKRIPGPWKKVATAMWQRDGEPEFNVMEPGSVGRHSYVRWSKDVFATLAEMGYEVKRSLPLATGEGAAMKEQKT
jgi:hypothetical protein